MKEITMGKRSEWYFVSMHWKTRPYFVGRSSPEKLNESRHWRFKLLRIPGWACENLPRVIEGTHPNLPITWAGSIKWSARGKRSDASSIKHWVKSKRTVVTCLPWVNSVIHNIISDLRVNSGELPHLSWVNSLMHASTVDYFWAVYHLPWVNPLLHFGYVGLRLRMNLTLPYPAETAQTWIWYPWNSFFFAVELFTL